LRAPLRGLLCGMPIAAGWGVFRMLSADAMAWQPWVWLGVGLAAVYGILGLVVYRNPRLRQAFWPAAIARKER
jgi:hypothetical protein